MNNIEDSVLGFKEQLFNKIDEISDKIDGLIVMEKVNDKKMTLPNTTYVNKKGYITLLEKQSSKEYQELYRKANKFLECCYSATISASYLMGVYEDIRPTLQKLKDREEMIYQLNEEIDEK